MRRVLRNEEEGRRHLFASRGGVACVLPFTLSLPQTCAVRIAIPFQQMRKLRLGEDNLAKVTV